MNVEVSDTVQRNHDDEPDTVVVVSPEEAALPRDGGEEGDVVTLAEHGDTVERGQQGEGDGLEVAILPCK